MNFYKKKYRKNDKEKLLDLWFSRYIRVRDTNNGICKCISCNRFYPPAEMSCGHFVKRDRKNIKYKEFNAHAQCHICNSTQDGEQGRQAINIDRLHGRGTAEGLLDMASRTGGLRKEWEFQAMADAYRWKVNTLLKLKKIEKWW